MVRIEWAKEGDFFYLKNLWGNLWTLLACAFLSRYLRARF
jgi:hypothetical protein